MLICGHKLNCQVSWNGNGAQIKWDSFHIPKSNWLATWAAAAAAEVELFKLETQTMAHSIIISIWKRHDNAGNVANWPIIFWLGVYFFCYLCRLCYLFDICSTDCVRARAHVSFWGCRSILLCIFYLIKFAFLLGRVGAEEKKMTHVCGKRSVRLPTNESSDK